jgi:hypothetical protein
MRARAEAAAKLAGLAVVAEHKRTGQALVIWRDGKVVKISAEQYEKELAQDGRAKTIGAPTSAPQPPVSE